MKDITEINSDEGRRQWCKDEGATWKPGVGWVFEDPMSGTDDWHFLGANVDEAVDAILELHENNSRYPDPGQGPEGF